jgi:DNA-binding SARP family transcriptional activator
MGSQLEIKTFGGLQLLKAGEPIVGLGSRKEEALFIYLALAERPQPRELLADLLWDDRSQKQAMANLRRVLTGLRKHFGPYVDITRNTASLAPESDLWLDVRELQARVALLKEGWDSLSSQMAAQVEAGIDLYQGDFLAGFHVRGASGFEAWLTEERAHWQQVVLEAAGLLSSYYEKSGMFPEAIALVRRMLQIDSLDEAAHRHLMGLLVASGQRSPALQQYEVCRQLLQAELGVEPSPKTKTLYEQIRSAELGTAIIQSDQARGYDLQEEIGAGTFGVVYRAIQPGVGREVAVKIIQPQFANHPDFIRRFEAEAQIVARLEHPHIVPLYDYWRGPDGAFLVTRWLRGGNLQSSLAQGPWELGATARLVDQIAGALASAHRRGVVHRDIKPANILLDEDRNGYLSDFGIAKDITLDTGITETGALVGSPAYISPEQALAEKVTNLTDIYSLGVVLYELLTGVHPFPDIVLAALIQKHLHEPFPAVREKRPELPEEIDEIIQRATAKNPSERFPDVLALVVAFREAARGVGRIEIVPVAGLVNPYKGLRSFQEADAADFFGRESLTKELLKQLTRESSIISKSQLSIAEADGRFLAVV